MRRNFTGFILTLALALLVLPTKTFAKDAVTITVSDAVAKPGETAEMVVLVEANAGVSGAGLTVVYNTTAMTLTDIRPLVSGTFLGDIERDSFSWLKGKNLSGSFELAALCFSIDASAGGDYTVEVKPIGDFAANITNQDAVPVAATFVPGMLSVREEDAGDDEDPVIEDPTPSGTEDPDASTTKDPDIPTTEGPEPSGTLGVEDSPTKPPEDDAAQEPPSTPEENKPQPSPTEEPKKEPGNIGLYVAVIAAAAVGFVAGTVRKKRK